MTTFENKSLKKEYVKSKIILRAWEDEFIEKNGRIPQKADIKLSPSYVRESYNKYYKIKIKLLATQILGKEDENNEDILPEIISKNEEINKEIISSNDENKISQESSSEIHNDDQNELKDLNNSCNSKKKIDSKIWGAELNKTKSNVKFKEKKKIVFNEALSKSLFEGASFKKRNPRKPSLSKNKKTKKSAELSNSSLHISEGETSVCREHDLQNRKSQNDSKLSNVVDTFESQAQTSISIEHDLQNREDQNIHKAKEAESFDHPVLQKSIKYNATIENLTSNQVGLVQQIISGSAGALQKIQNVQEGWVGKKIQQVEESWVENLFRGKENLAETIPSNSNFSLADPDSLLYNVKEKHNDNEVNKDDDSDDDDDDIIRGSDSELDENSKVKCPLPVKRKFEESSDLADKNFSSSDNQDNKKIKLTHSFSKDSEETCSRKIQYKKKALNDNFVKLNLMKKTYVRGKRKFNFSRYKKQKWKKEKKSFENSIESESKYSNINEIDHFEPKKSRRLPKQLIQFDEEKDLYSFDDDAFTPDSQILSETREKNLFQNDIVQANEPITENFTSANLPPFYDFHEDGSTRNSQQTEVFEALKLFGHSNFLPGQEETIMRILRGQSTLFISSTGGGKSLCYQLPAYLYSKRSKSIALVISPLISLMEDQVSSSSFFKAGYFHSDQSQKQNEAVLEKAKSGKLYAILISPEMVASGDSIRVFNNVFKHLPPISFACIDEIHCMSHWSHNFRPSYLLINRVLREKFGIKTILGLTATATVSTIENITKEIGISKTDGVIKTGFLPENLHLSISRDEKKDEALLDLLKSPKFKDLQSTIIYCKRRDECERLAVLIRTVFHNDNIVQATNKKQFKQLSFFAESYHAGMTAARRKMIQKAFMSGNIRIVVATVAFGMGINKSDIGAVIHYNIPKDFENYVQEIGRAGRNGSPAYCHLFLDTTGEDLCQLSSHVHSVSVDRHVIRKLLEKVFRSCNCEAENKQCEGHEIAFSCDDTVFSLDIPQINIQTLLCYLELHPKKFIKVLSPTFFKCKIKSYRGTKALIDAIKICPPLARVHASMTEPNKKRDVWEFDVVKVASEIGWRSEAVKSKLRSLEWQLSDKCRREKTGISVEFFDLGFRIRSRGDLKPSELDEALEYLIGRVEDQQIKSLNHLDIVFSIFNNFATDTYRELLDNNDPSKSEKLKEAIRYYFETEQLLQDIPLQKFKMEDFDEAAVAGDIRALISAYSDNLFNSRSVARIFHGISSPNYPASMWCKNRFWRKHRNKDFNKIIELAKYEILRSKF